MSSAARRLPVRIWRSGLALALLLGLSLATTPFSAALFSGTDATTGAFTTDTLAPPTSLSAAAGLNVVLAWTATTDTYATGYHVYRATALAGPYAQIASVTPVAIVIYTDSPAAGTYYYLVRAYYQNWESVGAGPVSATVGSTSSTGYQPCAGASNAPDTVLAGDNDGYESNPSRACTNDSSFATDSNSGTGVGGDASCGVGAVPNSIKDRHRWWGFAFGLPGSVTSIDGIEVQIDEALNNNAGTTDLCVQLSWDGGTTWTTIKSQGLTVIGETTYTFGASSDAWGHTWTATELNTSNFRVRVIDASDRTAKQFRLDYLQVQVTYTP